MSLFHSRVAHVPSPVADAFLAEYRKAVAEWREAHPGIDPFALPFDNGNLLGSLSFQEWDYQMSLLAVKRMPEDAFDAR